MKSTEKERIVATVFFVLTILFIFLFVKSESFFNWVFDRHHNQLSWYIRPLFLIPFCYFSYKRSLAGISITLFLLFTSMFWFPKPEVVDPTVQEFLQFEKDFLQEAWDVERILLVLTIPTSFVFLAISFWKRSIIIGIGVIVLMALGKILWSINNAGQSGKSILIPAIIGLIVCCGLIFWGFKRIEKD